MAFADTDLTTMAGIKEGFELRYLTGLSTELDFTVNEAMAYSCIYSLAKWVNNKHRRTDSDGNVWVRGNTAFILDVLGWESSKSKTLQRAIRSLTEKGYLVSQQCGYDRSKWFHVVSVTTSF